jgi:hypothetical protein
MKFSTRSAYEASVTMGKLKQVSDELGLHFLTTAGAFAKFTAVAKNC